MKFIIRDENGKKINTIIASQDYVDANFPGRYEAIIEEARPAKASWLIKMVADIAAIKAAVVAKP